MSDTLWLRSDTALRRRTRRWRPTLRQLFSATVVALLLGLSALFYILFVGSQRAIMQNASTLRENAARELAGRVREHLAKAEDAQRDIETQIHSGVLPRGDLLALEAALFARLAHHPQLSELTLTYAVPKGRGEEGEMLFEPQGRWQISVFREAEKITTQKLLKDGEAYVLETRTRNSHAFDANWHRDTHRTFADPASHLTFTTPVHADFYGRSLWSDLHWSEFGDRNATDGRRVAISLQKALEDSSGRFAGVLRVGLLADQLVAKVQLAPPGETDPHRVFVCDRQGRLVSRLSPLDRFEENGDDLRVRALGLSPELKATLRLPELKSMDRMSSARFESGGEMFLATFQALEGSHDWLVGIVVPENAYLKDLTTARNRLLVLSTLVMVLILMGGAWTLTIVRRDLDAALLQTENLGRFQFAPSEQHARIADVDTILDGLERSKTSMRAICKYVPVELVRLLHEAHAEPVLGSESRELTIMFTDLKDFTTAAEQLPPNQLASALGSYLQAMTDAVHSTQGTVDKYIGDAVMAFWNAPTSDAEHARKACEAALRCVEATERLYASAEWMGRPPLVTRFGLHRAHVMVGHFGAPDRLNYTAIGDGVNAAARLEGLNKEYGTSILASEAVYELTKTFFRFRFIDDVAVKGKRQSLKVYELLGRSSGKNEPNAAARTYEAAFERYRQGEFAEALELLARNTEDAPSRVLATRCAKYLNEKPESDWNGVHHAALK
jgi:adenylate cyclase